ncbi:MAG: hypothetical protein DRQ60_06205 [Gammaproteobacteria bacterium]|nr:MAG: hypothetical protein DRQ54_03690 [Gammaproteobacteria bacterium]RLA14509.1 MAG: hypothetical protein DRQ52_04000 [Gammaproteobacteria bacterium]RLA14936.1 MAG: hypothetical protein DRQ60_06205 [Gammaproteobacteria bacterium]
MTQSELLSTESEPTPLNSLGKLLLAAREERKISVQEIADSLNLTTQKIEALEQDNYDLFPGRTYVRGSLIGYARYVSIDPSIIKERLAETFPEPQHSRSNFKPIKLSTASDGPGKKIKAGLVMLILAAVVFAAYNIYLDQLDHSLTDPVLPTSGEDRTDVSSAQSGTLAPIPENDPLSTQTSTTVRTEILQTRSPAGRTTISTPLSAQAGTDSNSVDSASAAANEPVTGEIVLKFNGSSWADIRASDGSKLLYNLQPAGSEITLSAQLPIKVFLGNAPEVSVFYNGELYEHPIRGRLSQFTLDSSAVNGADTPD